jgi:hypothetical protein
LNVTGSGLDEHMEQSRRAQRRADKWLISGSLLIGTAALGVFGLPLFLRGVWLLRKAQRDGLTVRPMLVTLLGYLVIIDAGYFWHYNELWLGGAAGPGEKALEVGLMLTVFTMRIAAAIGSSK